VLPAAHTDAARSRSQIPHKEPASGTGSVEAAVQRHPNRLKRYLQILGPGLITGASDDDPSGIGTYAVAGASLGLATLWTALVTLPLMATVQFICAKIGMVSGHGLAGVLRRHYPRALLYPAVIALLVANTINAGADIGAIAAGINIIVPLPIGWMIPPLVLIILGLQIFVPPDREHLQVADAGAVRLHRVVTVRPPGPRRGRARHAHPDPAARHQFSDDAGRHPGHDHLALPVLLAVQPGGRGRNPHGPHHVGPTPRRNRP
jgi:hypothetical protein